LHIVAEADDRRIPKSPAASTTPLPDQSRQHRSRFGTEVGSPALAIKNCDARSGRGRTPVKDRAYDPR
jgi:hypothetical protein